MFSEAMMVVGAGLAAGMLVLVVAPKNRRGPRWAQRIAIVWLALALWVALVALWGAWGLGSAAVQAFAAAGEQEAVAQARLGSLYEMQQRISEEAARREEIQAAAGGPAGPWAEDMPGFAFVQEAIAASEGDSPEARAEFTPERVAAELARLDKMYP